MFNISELARNVHQIDIETTGKDWEAWALLTSDWHWDNPKAVQPLIKKHLDQAKERNAMILGFGDLLCLMQGKYDPRRSKSDIRPEHNRLDYLDAVIRDFAGFLIPYKDNFCLYGQGNHETAIVRNLETNPVERVVERVNTSTGSRSVFSGGYGGWVRFRFSMGTAKQVVDLKYFHGSGGGGIVTKGAIQQQRMAATIEGANIIYMGHVHELTSSIFTKEYISNVGEVKRFNQVHLRGSTYKEEYKDGYGGYHIEKGRPPKPLGSWWVRFYKESAKKVTFEWIPAI